MGNDIKLYNNVVSWDSILSTDHCRYLQKIKSVCNLKESSTKVMAFFVYIFLGCY